MKCDVHHIATNTLDECPKCEAGILPEAPGTIILVPVSHYGNGWKGELKHQPADPTDRENES